MKRKKTGDADFFSAEETINLKLNPSILRYSIIIGALTTDRKQLKFYLIWHENIFPLPTTNGKHTHTHRVKKSSAFASSQNSKAIL